METSGAVQNGLSPLWPFSPLIITKSSGYNTKSNYLRTQKITKSISSYAAEKSKGTSLRTGDSVSGI